MSKSTITSKSQTTIPKDVREKLGIGPGDVLEWHVVGRQARVSAGDAAFLERRGTVRVGAGSPSADVRRARALRGTERR